MENTEINITIMKITDSIDARSEDILGDIELPEHSSTDPVTPADIIVENIDIKLELADTIDIESNDSFFAIKSNHRIKQKHKREKLIIPKQLEREPHSHPEKMRSCGTWFDECFDCCCMPIQCIASSCSFCSDCCSEIAPKVKPVYFFILYLFTGELNKEAEGYKNYFNIKSKKEDQVNIPEILITATSIVFELYKTMIGSFLTVFTSQRCGQQTCTILENIVPKNDLELAGIVVNFLMATSLLIEYIFEIMREAYLIKYLKYNKYLANNGEHIAELYENTDKSIFEKLIPLYIIYIRFSYVVLLIYFVNVVLSAVIVSENYYDNTSIFSFVTNALFIIYKIYNVVEITSYRGDYFYSAYKRKNIHYNDVKSKYLLKNQQFTVNNEESSLNTMECSSKEFIDIQQDNAIVNENTVIDIAPTLEEESKVEEPIKTPTIQDVIASLFTSKKAIVPKPPKLSDIDYVEELDELGLDDAERDKVLKALYKENYIDKMVFYQAMLVRRNN